MRRLAWTTLAILAVSSRPADAHQLDEYLQAIWTLADDPAFRNLWARVKRSRKLQLTALIKERTGTVADPDTLFDVQVKRLDDFDLGPVSFVKMDVEGFEDQVLRGFSD